MYASFKKSYERRHVSPHTTTFEFWCKNKKIWCENKNILEDHHHNHHQWVDSALLSESGSDMMLSKSGSRGGGYGLVFAAVHYRFYGLNHWEGDCQRSLL